MSGSALRKVQAAGFKGDFLDLKANSLASPNVLESLAGRKQAAGVRPRIIRGPQE